MALFTPSEWMIARRYLRAQRQEGFVSVITWFSLIGMALGVGTLIVVMAVMNGFRNELLDRILGISGHVVVMQPPEGIAEYDALVARIAPQEGVKEVFPLIRGQVMITSPHQSAGAQVIGMTPEDLARKPIIRDGIVAGGLEPFGRGEGVVIGQRLAHKLGVWEGDKVTLISPQGHTTVLGKIPRMMSYPVTAVFDIGMYEYDATTLFLPMGEAQRYFRMAGRASAIELTLERAGIAPSFAAALERELGGGYQVYDWQRSNAQFFNALEVERNVMFLILTMIILVAAFNIISSLIMLVQEKGRGIAILRTMGASSGSVMRIFILCGMSIGVVGTLTGVGLGLAFALNIETIRGWLEQATGTELFAAEIYFLSRLPADVQWPDVLSVGGMGIGLSFLATLYPAWRAGRTDPAEALRYE